MAAIGRSKFGVLRRRNRTARKYRCASPVARSAPAICTRTPADGRCRRRQCWGTRSWAASRRSARRPPGAIFREQPLGVGDRLTWSVAANSGAFSTVPMTCRKKCATLFKYGHEKIDERAPFAGGLADFVLLRPGTACLRVPEHLSDAMTAPANCATATMAGLLRRRGGRRRRQATKRVGSRRRHPRAYRLPMARSGGAAVVAVSDPNAARREWKSIRRDAPFRR